MTEELEVLAKKLSECRTIDVKGKFVFVRMPGEKSKRNYPILRAECEGLFAMTNLKGRHYQVRCGTDERIFKFCFKGEGDWYVGKDSGLKDCLKLNCPAEGNEAEAWVYLTE